MKLKIAKSKPVEVTIPAPIPEEEGEVFEAVVVPSKKKGVQYSDLIAQATELQSKCNDYPSIGVKEVTYEDNAFILNYKVNEQFVRSTALSDYALGQLSTKLGVPINYVRKCVNSGNTELALKNLNNWVPQVKTNYLVREYKDTIRAILSEKYSVYDTLEILNAGADPLKDFSIKGYFLNEERLHMRLVSDQVLNVPNEVLKAGLQIDSSDVGRSTLLITFFVYRQVCTNGLTVAQGSGKMFSQKHIGITSESITKGLESALGALPQMTKGVEEFIIKAQSSSNYVSFAKSIAKADVNKAIKDLQSVVKVSEGEAKKVIELIQSNKYNTTDWGVVNALTEVAQSYTLERRLEIEKLAGSLLIA